MIMPWPSVIVVMGQREGVLFLAIIMSIYCDVVIDDEWILAGRE